MTEAKKSHLPIGYWLKKADEVLTTRINEAQRANGLSRAEWQILNVLSEIKVATREQLASPMRPFADDPMLSDAVLLLVQRGLIEGNGSASSGYRLTKLGRDIHEAAFFRQKEVRQRAVTGISEVDYITAVRVLQQLVKNLDVDGVGQQGAPSDAPNNGAPLS